MSETDPGQRHDDPLDTVEVEERGVAERLHDGRPEPSSTFRSELRGRLIPASPQAAPAERGTPVPLITGYLAGGVILLLVAAAGIAGIGPFAS